MTWWNASTDSWSGAKVSPLRALATRSPMSETPTSPATRATALLIADAMPGVVRVSVGEDCRSERSDGEREAKREQKQRRQEVCDVRRVHSDPQEQEDAGRRDQRPCAHEEARPVRSASAPNRRDNANITRVTGRVARPLRSHLASNLLQENHEEEEEIASPAYIASVSRLPTEKFRREKSSSFSIGFAHGARTRETPRTRGRLRQAVRGSPHCASRDWAAGSGRRRFRPARSRTESHRRGRLEVASRRSPQGRLCERGSASRERAGC